jgi:hypothetical protein
MAALPSPNLHLSAPAVTWCEQTVYGWIDHMPLDYRRMFPCEPLNSYSSLAYLSVAFLLYFDKYPRVVHPVLFSGRATGRYLNLGHMRLLRLYVALCSLMLAAGSFGAHSCGTTLFGLYGSKRGYREPWSGALSPGNLDQYAMFFMFYLAVILRLWRVLVLCSGNLRLLHTGPAEALPKTILFFVHPLVCVALQTAQLVLQLPNAVNHALFFGSVILAALLDLAMPMLKRRYAHKCRVEKPKSGLPLGVSYLGCNWILMVAAFALWVLDTTGWLCAWSHLGHAWWHVLTALTPYLFLVDLFSEQWWPPEGCKTKESEALRELMRDVAQEQGSARQRSKGNGKGKVQGGSEYPSPSLAYITALWLLASVGVYMVIAVYRFGQRLMLLVEIPEVSSLPAPVRSVLQRVLAGVTPGSLLLLPNWLFSAAWPEQLQDHSDGTWVLIKLCVPLCVLCALGMALGNRLITTLLSRARLGLSRVEIGAVAGSVSSLVVLVTLAGWQRVLLLCLWATVCYSLTFFSVAQAHGQLDEKTKFRLYWQLCVANAAIGMLLANASNAFAPGARLVTTDAILPSAGVSSLTLGQAFTCRSSWNLGCLLSVLQHYHVLWLLVLLSVGLRVASFTLDFVCATSGTPLTNVNAYDHNVGCVQCARGEVCEFKMQEFPLPPTAYSYPSFLLYVLHAPSLLAGATRSFNSFCGRVQIESHSGMAHGAAVFRRAVVCVCWFVLVEFVLSLCYVDVLGSLQAFLRPVKLNSASGAAVLWRALQEPATPYGAGGERHWVDDMGTGYMGVLAVQWVVLVTWALKLAFVRSLCSLVCVCVYGTDISSSPVATAGWCLRLLNPEALVKVFFRDVYLVTTRCLYTPLQVQLGGGARASVLKTGLVWGLCVGGALYGALVLPLTQGRGEEDRARLALMLRATVSLFAVGLLVFSFKRLVEPRHAALWWVSGVLDACYALYVSVYLLDASLCVHALDLQAPDSVQTCRAVIFAGLGRQHLTLFVAFAVLFLASCAVRLELLFNKRYAAYEHKLRASVLSSALLTGDSRALKQHEGDDFDFELNDLTDAEEEARFGALA